MAFGFLAITAFAADIPAQHRSGATAIRDVAVFDATGSDPFVADVLIQEGRFTAIGSGIDMPTDAVLIDGSGLSILPGLIDIHLHWTTMGGASRSDIATQLLLSGVTTTTDFHSAPASFPAKRDWHEQLVSPDVLYTARIGTPGGHGTSWGDENTTSLITSAREAEVALAAIQKYQPSLIKVFADGWRYGSRINNHDMNFGALAAVVEQAGARSLPVVSHTVTVEGAKIAAEAGVAAVVHAIQDRNVDDELVRLMQDNRVFYAPSLAVYEPRPDKTTELDTSQMQLVMQRQTLSRSNLLRFYEAGIAIALGSDSGIAATPFGESSLRELELLVDFGMSASDALIAGTANSADVLGLKMDRGTIEVGKRADFVLVRGQPWRNISELRKLESVFIGGSMVVQHGKLLAQQGPALPTAVRAQPLIDDFEGFDDLTAGGAVRHADIDDGFPRSALITQRVPRDGGGAALHLSARMAIKDSPRALVGLPMTPGGFVPVDARAFRGITFDARGDAGCYMVEIVSSAGNMSLAFNAGQSWNTINLPFDKFVTGNAGAVLERASIFEVRIGAQRDAGDVFWMELDNVGFFDAD